MNPKPNDSQAEVNDNEIVIDENIGNNRPDVVEGVTAEPNYETPERKQSFFSTKKGKKVLFGIIGVVLLSVLITILVILLRKKTHPCDDPNGCCNDPNGCCNDPNGCPEPCDDPNGCCNDPNGCPEPCNDPNGCEPCTEPECTVVDIEYNKGDVYIYEESLSKVSNVELSNRQNNGRILEDDSRLSEKSTITTKYLINIYDYDEDKEVYYAYAAVIDMNMQVESKKAKSMGGNDLTKSSEVDDNVPVAQFTFKKNGKILTFNPNEKMDEILLNYLYEFVQKVIPDVSIGSFSSNQPNESRNHSIIDRKNGELNDNRTSEDEENDNSEGRNWKTIIEKSRITKVEGKRDFALKVNYERQFKANTGNFSEDIETDQSVNRGTLIKQMKNDYTSIITLSDNSTNEEMTNKITDLLKNVNFPLNDNRNLANFERKLNNLRNLQETIYSDTYSNSIHFYYPLFKSNLLGATVGLIADVEFMPMNGKFNTKMNFDANGKIIPVYSFEKETNFNQIIYGIKNITRQIYTLLYQDSKTVQPIFDEFQTNITKSLDAFYNEIKVLPQLKSVEFKQELERILLKVNETTANTYSEVYQSSTQATQEYNMILSNIQKGEESFVTSIKTTSSNTVEDFIEKNKVNLESLFNAWTNFYNEMKIELEEKKKEITNNRSFIFDIGLYYNIKDEMNASIKVYKEFAQNLESSLNIEHEKFTTEVNEKFNEKIEPKLMEAEKIAEEAKYNISVIDAMRQVFNNGEGDKIRTHMINEINSLRDTLNNIMKEILSQISLIYKSNIESQAFVSFKNSLTGKYNQMILQQEELLQKLRVFNKYDIAFDIYFDDIIILNELEIEVNNRKKESYKKYIGDYINKQTEYTMLQSQVTEIKTTITNYFKQLQQYTDDLKWTDAEIYSKTFVNIIKSINQKYLTVELANKIINYYSDKTFINKMFDNYYNDLYNIYKVFNTTFYDKYYLKHAPNYVSKPTELINKLLDISYYLNPDFSQLHITVQKLIETKIINDISSISTKIYQIIYEEYNKFIQNIYSSKCCVNGYNYANIEKIKIQLKKFTELYYDEDGKFIQIYTYTPSTKEDAFNLKNIIIQKTNEIRYNILRIVDQINIDFHDTFCYGIQVYCAFINVVGQIEHYYYQASKLRVSLKFIQSLVVIAQSMITENTLIDLKPTKYKELFKLEFNYKETEILTDINSFLAELNDETYKYINKTIIKVQTSIENYFETGITEGYIKTMIGTIANDIFEDEFGNQINEYLYYACGPESKIIQAFSSEIEFHKLLSENKFYFNLTSYAASYDNLINRITNVFSEEKTKFLDSLKVSDVLVDKLKKKVKDFIAESYQLSNNNINALTDITEFQFLNMSFSLKDIIQKALTKVSNSINSIIDTNIKNIFDEKFEGFKTQINRNLSNSFAYITQVINLNFDATERKYNQYGSTFDNSISLSYNYTVIAVQETTINIIGQTIITFFEKIKLIYSDSNLLQMFNERLTRSLSKNTFTFINQNYSSTVKENILELYSLSHKRLVEERSLFQQKISEFYLNAFKVIINQFVNGKGKDYVLEAVNFDYENTIYHDFTLMKTAINQTYYIVKTLLDGAELRTLGWNLVNTFNTIFPNIRDKINAIIPERIEKVIYPKITSFKNEANNLIAELYISTLENEGRNLEQVLSSNVFELIPTKLGTSFKGIIQNNFNDAIKNIIEDIKQTYNTKILTDLRLITSTMTTYGNEISYAVNSAQILETARIWYSIEDIYYKLNEVYDEYNTNSVLEIESQKTTEIESFIDTRIINLIKQIIEKYHEQNEKRRITMNTELAKFTVNSLVNSTLTDIKNSNLKDIIGNYQTTFNTLFQQFITRISAQFIDFQNSFKNKTSNISITGFDKVRRNLYQEYYLLDIEEALEGIEQKYEKLSTNILKSTSYANIENIRHSLVITINNEASTLTNNFYPYRVLIQQYTDNAIIDKYFKDLESDAKEIKNEAFDFIVDASNEIQKAINIIYERRVNSWYEIRKKINEVVFESLDVVFRDKFSQLTDLSYEGSNINMKSLRVDPIYVTGKDGESLNEISFNITDINYKYGYSLMKDGDYNFKMNVYTEGDITLDIISNVGDRVIEKISGKLGSGKVGLNANYILHNKQVNYEAFATINEVQYNVVATSQDGYKFYNTNPSDSQKKISMKKEMKNILVKIK